MADQPGTVIGQIVVVAEAEVVKAADLERPEADEEEET
jgi:hypothetical protein